MLLKSISAFALCMILAFAAEPTTSTQYDLHQGRGVAVVHSGTVSAKGPAGLAALPQILRTLLASVVALAVTVVAALRLLADVERPLVTRRLERQCPLGRRGPPAVAR